MPTFASSTVMTPGQLGPISRTSLPRIAHGVIEAAKEVKINVPLVVRLQGTNADEGRKLLAESGLKLEVANDLWEAAQKIVKLTGKAA